MHNYLSFPEVQVYNSTRVYRIINDKIYMASSGKDERFYGNMKKVKDRLWRYTANHEIWAFYDADFSKAYLTAVSSGDTQIGELECRQITDKK